MNCLFFGNFRHDCLFFEGFRCYEFEIAMLGLSGGSEGGFVKKQNFDEYVGAIDRKYSFSETALDADCEEDWLENGLSCLRSRKIPVVPSVPAGSFYRKYFISKQ